MVNNSFAQAFLNSFCSLNWCNKNKPIEVLKRVVSGKNHFENVFVKFKMRVVRRNLQFVCDSIYLIH